MVKVFTVLFGGVIPSQVRPLAITLVIVVVYVPDGAFFRVKPTSPLLLVVPVAIQELFPFESRIETDASLTLFESSDTCTVTVRCLSPAFPPFVVYVIESTPTRVPVTGGVPTVIVIESLLVFPPASMTWAVMVCVPSLRAVENEPPEPIIPSILDVHVNPAVMFPSSVSVAEPAKEITVAESNDELSEGLEIETVGELFVVDVPGYRKVIPSMSSCCKTRFGP